MREGLVPTVLGTAVTATGAAFRGKYPMAATAAIGFGVAHIVLGAIDLAQHRHQHRHGHRHDHV
ncbi:MAG: asparagine synthase [Paenibacillaceae bacterium]|nr:asparagine synthase [Paenibacillaceae bacterium]